MSTTSDQLYLDAPYLGALEKARLCQAVETGFVSTIGPLVPEFEQRVADLLGVERAVSTQSGTAALHISLLEAGIGAGDQVIVPALTFAATVNPIIYLGAEPVFVDVDRDMWTLDPQELESSITSKTKAVVPVHLFGNPCDMGAVKDVARRHGLTVVEDAAESLGAEIEGKQTGTLGDFGCFSFNGNKTITTGGGGMVVAKDGDRIEHIRFLVNQARSERQGSFYHPEVGYNYRMTNLEAALGLAQLERLRDLLARKRRFRRIYEEELGGLKQVRFQGQHPAATSSCWLTCLTAEGAGDPSSLVKKLKRHGIPTRRIFTPLVEFPPYARFARTALVRSFEIYRSGLCLPSSCVNSPEAVRRACRVLRDVLAPSAAGA